MIIDGRRLRADRPKRDASCDGHDDRDHAEQPGLERSGYHST
jgi:hypothetical protein